MVDDEPFNLKSNEIIVLLAVKELGLDPLQFKTFIDFASDGKEAVDRVKQLYNEKKQQYALILTDCSMPVMDGYQGSSLIREYYEY